MNLLARVGRWRSAPRKTAAPRRSEDQVLRQAGFSPISETGAADIFLVGFPKSGNTWMQNLVAGLWYGMDTRYLPDRLTQTLVPDVHRSSWYKRISEPAFFKSHFLPRQEYRRVVYVVRDGRDAVWSYFHMLQAMKVEGASLHSMIAEGRFLFPCPWHEHVAAWLANPWSAEMIVIRYEDLLTDPMIEMKRLCNFAGIERTDAEIRRTVEGNSFERMQEKEARFGWDSPDWDPGKKFIRTGKAGEYRNGIPTDLIRHFETMSAEQLAALGYGLDS